MKAGWSAIASARRKAGYQPEAAAHAFTVEEYRKRFELTDQVARRELVAMVEAGVLRRGRKWGVSRAGRPMRLNCYWPVEEGKACTGSSNTRTKRSKR